MEWSTLWCIIWLNQITFHTVMSLQPYHTGGGTAIPSKRPAHSSSSPNTEA